MSRELDLGFKREFERMQADEEEAVAFLASVIKSKDKERMRKEIESDPDFKGKQHFILGMTVRNALRKGGFTYFPQLMDAVWFSWLEKAVNLPREQIVMSNSLKQRIMEYRTGVGRPLSEGGSPKIEDPILYVLTLIAGFAGVILLLLISLLPYLI